MYANVKRQKSIKPSMRNRKDQISVIQASHCVCVSVSDMDDCSCGELFLFVLSLIAMGQSESRQSFGEERGFPEEMEASCLGFMCQIIEASFTTIAL